MGFGNKGVLCRRVSCFRNFLTVLGVCLLYTAVTGVLVITDYYILVMKKLTVLCRLLFVP